MADWLKANAISLLIAGCTLISTYAIYGYRLSIAEGKIQYNQDRVAELERAVVQTEITLTKLEVGLEYIKVQLEKLVE